MIEQAWCRLLERVNKKLLSKSRKAISRYHAADCNGSFNDFEYWTPDERRELHEQILAIFSRHRHMVVSYTLNLKELVDEFPRAEEKSENVANILLLSRIMEEISVRLFGDKRYSTDRIALIHDHGMYDAVLLDAFNNKKSDETLKHREQFVTIAPMCWEDCIPLQSADFLAYENFKAALRTPQGYKRRKTLELLLNLNSFGGIGSTITRYGIKETMEKYDEAAKQKILENARIRSIHKPNDKSNEGSSHRNTGGSSRQKRRKKAEEN